MYIDLNERKHLFAERFIRISKNKIYKSVSVSKNLYIDKLDDKYTKYYNTYLIGVNSSTYINSGKENNEKDPKFEVGGHVHISKKKFFFAKGYTPNWSEENFVIKKVENTVPNC